VCVVERKPKMAFVDTGLRDEIMKRAEEIAEKVAREVIPDIAERVIREEIEKLKKGV
jgi:undecaprenyl pyrophosphate synthase